MEIEARTSCVVRTLAAMLQGLPATEQCVLVDGVNFLLNADIDSQALSPDGAPNIMIAGGTQLRDHFEDDGLYVYKFHVDWVNFSKTSVSAPRKITVAPYRYLCNGQLTKCVTQPETDIRLDAQGDKLMQRLVYRRIGRHEWTAEFHSVDTKAGGGGVRWYEFKLDKHREPQLYQQGTYAPGGFYRWMPSLGIDRKGDIGIGYSFGGDPDYTGQRFVARLAKDPKGVLTFKETVLKVMPLKPTRCVGRTTPPRRWILPTTAPSGMSATILNSRGQLQHAHWRLPPSWLLKQILGHILAVVQAGKNGSIQVERRTLGLNGPEVSPIGLGCFGLSNAYGIADPEEATATILHALNLGCNFLDTADSYGAGQNEQLVGRAIKQRRDEVVLATKFGFVCDTNGHVVGRNGTPAYVHKAIDASLRRLGTEAVDIYTLHRVDPDVAIEETIGAMADLISLGKVRHLGLSETSAEQVRRAHAVHPIATLQSEYSLWTRDPEGELMTLCHDLGIGFVAFCPLGRGIFSGTLGDKKLQRDDFRRTLPRFEPDNLKRNLELVRGLEDLAKRKLCTPAQLALSWILQKGKDIAAIPGTRRQRHLEENLRALEVQWTDAELQELDELFSPEHIHGTRYSRESLFKPE